jgi:hypothetical protein
MRRRRRNFIDYRVTGNRTGESKREDAGFEGATRLWNGMIEKTPALVVQPTGTADIVAALSQDGGSK